MASMNPISAVILKMSESSAWERRVSGWRVTRRVVERFMPGEQLDDAVSAARRINEGGMSTSLNPVGEHVHSEAEATAATDAYVAILERIRTDQLDSNVSVKLSLLGLDLGTEVATANLERILEAAQRHGLFVRIDMESSAYVDRTLQIWEQMRARFAEVGVVIQSYLRRSAADVDWLIERGAAIRLVKGAYKEPDDIAFPDKADVDQNFRRLMARLLDEDARANGVRLAVATHDRSLVEDARKLAAERAIEDGLEFQMLYGIARDLQKDTVAGRFPVRIYISYGKAWYPWFMRRLAERPANLGFFLKHLLS
jgi:proline dehydrogenase